MSKTSIAYKFLTLRKKGKKAFIPYIMAGYPSAEDTLKITSILEECGADMMELGVPFTDPLADGPVIQAASEEALRQGMNLRKVLRLVERLKNTSTIPIVLMTYYNPVFKYGEENFIKDALNAGVSGVIIPDLPPDEAHSLRKAARKYGLDTIFLAAPTSTSERLRLIAKASTGFIYYVSITGITGSKLVLDGSQRYIMDTLRKLTDKPIATGFGVSTPEEARAVAEFSDGVIVGSAIVKRLTGSLGDLKSYISQIEEAIHSISTTVIYTKEEITTKEKR